MVHRDWQHVRVHTLHRGQGLMVNIRMAVKKYYKH